MTLFKHYRSESAPKRSYWTYFKEPAIPKQGPSSSFFSPKGKNKTQNKPRLVSKVCTLRKQLAVNTWGYWWIIIIIWFLLHWVLSSRQEQFASTLHQCIQHRQIPALNRNGEFHKSLVSQRPGSQEILYWVSLSMPNTGLFQTSGTEAPSPRALLRASCLGLKRWQNRKRGISVLHGHVKCHLSQSK